MTKIKEIRWVVEYNWIDTKWGKRAERMRTFKTEEEANEFSKTVSDGVIGKWTEI